MIVFANPLALLLAIPLIALTLFFWKGGFATLSPGHRLVALGVRLTLVVTVILALSGLALRLPQSRQAVVFVADLSASDAAGKGAMRALIDSAVARRHGENSAGVVSLGRQALVEQPVSSFGAFHGFQSRVDTEYTNLQSGLDLAGALLPDGYRRRVVLLSDGQQNLGDALGTARLLRSHGVRVDVAPVRASGAAEVLVDRVDVPSQLRPQESFSVAVSLHSTVDTTTEVSIYRDRRLVLHRRERLHGGENLFAFRQAPVRPHFHIYQVRITPTKDTDPKNNSGSAFTMVQGPQPVLVIAANPAKAANVVASLRATGIPVELTVPWKVDPTIQYLQRYASVVIVDTAADVLGSALMRQLVPYVRNLGHGLVVTGGEQSYGLGGYDQTPLERALPVTMTLPKQKDLPTVAVALLIEDLESDENVHISKEAGKRIVSLLTPQDQVAVNDTPDDGTTGWVVRLQHPTNKDSIKSAIDRMEPGDTMSYTPYLVSAYRVLQHARARVKHIILVGDGDPSDSDDKSVLRKIRAGGVTVSTVATNDMFGFGDPHMMHDIARWGGGRYYRASNTSRVPQIFLREARALTRSATMEGKFYPTNASANPMVRGLHALPPLYGYVVTKLKPTGELVLASNKHDPILAGWQYGLGRVVAWTSDTAGLWTRDWLQAPGANRFWVNLVSWTLPAAKGGSLFLTTTSAQGQGRITADMPPSLGTNPQVTARIVDPSLHVTTSQLQPSAPGRYGGTFGATAQGAYFVTVEARSGKHVDVGQGGLAVPYSVEHRRIGTDMTFLRTLAAAGGGSIITRPQAVWVDNLTTVFDRRPLADPLWVLALLLLPLDIAVRRLAASTPGRSNRRVVPLGRGRE